MLENLVPLLPFFLFILGAILGSFANVIIYRLPAKESIVTPRSHCSKCKKMISWHDNIPILSWFILKGKCRQCGEKFSFRYALVEFIMAALFVVVYCFTGVHWSLVENLTLVFGLVTVSFIDIDHFILPDTFTLSGIAIGLLGSFLNPERMFIDSLLGMLAGGGFLWSIAAVYYALRKEEGMGGGDIKLLAWIGAVLGWSSIPFVIITSSLIGSIIGVVIALRSQKKFKTAIPFGPYLAFSAVLYICGGELIGKWYMGLFFPQMF